MAWFLICLLITSYKAKLIGASNIRLVGGQNKYEGRLEIYDAYSGSWGTVCDDNFGTTSAMVVCKQLGISSNGTVILKFGGGHGSIFLDEVKCRGTETDIVECPHYGWGSHDCNHDEDVGIKCARNFKLHKGTNMLEILLNNKYFKVCNNGVSDTIAKTVCDHWGLQSNGIASNFFYSTDQFVDSLACNHTDPYLFQCTSTYTSSGTCKNGFVVVNCKHVRLIDGTSPLNGRLELYLNGIWGNVCDYGFNNAAASVICRMLGISWNGKFSSEFRGGSRSFIMGNVRCTGIEDTLFDCSYNPSFSCDHNQDVGIECIADSMDLQFFGGETTKEGIAQIKLGKHMSNVCKIGFRIPSAMVFCREMIGNTGSVAVVSGKMFRSTTPYVYMEQFDCNGTETKLVYCQRAPLQSCPENEVAGVVCDPTQCNATQDVPLPMTVNVTVNVSCTAIGGNPSPQIWWNCSGVSEPVYTNVSETRVVSVLNITPNISLNGQNCTCFVNQIETMFPMTEITETLNVHYPVQSGLALEMRQFTENIFENMTCKASTGNPLPTLFWTCDGVQDDNVSMEISTGTVKATLHINPIPEYHNKTCTCIAFQENTMFDNLTESVVLNVHYAVNPEVIVTSTELVDDNYGYLVCRVFGGNPRPLVRLMCNGLPFPAYMIKLPNDTLSLLSLKATQQLDGQRCICFINQPATTFLEIQQIFVLHVSRAKNLTEDARDHNSVTMQSDRITTEPSGVTTGAKNLTEDARDHNSVKMQSDIVTTEPSGVTTDVENLTYGTRSRNSVQYKSVTMQSLMATTKRIDETTGIDNLTEDAIHLRYVTTQSNKVTTEPSGVTTGTHHTEEQQFAKHNQTQSPVGFNTSINGTAKSQLTRMSTWLVTAIVVSVIITITILTVVGVCIIKWRRKQEVGDNNASFVNAVYVKAAINEDDFTNQSL